MAPHTRPPYPTRIILSLLLIAGFSLVAMIATAQPTDQQIIKDLTKPGVLKVELSGGVTKKEWHSTQGQYMWDRVAYVWRSAEVPEYPQATVKITGIARYHYGASTSFREFKVAENEYFGLPAPSKDEMIGMIRERYLAFLGWRANSMVGDLHFLRIPEGEGVLWHTPRSFTIPVEIEFDAKTSIYDLTTIYEKVDVRFYRDAVTGPWKENLVATSRERKDGEVRKYSAEELSAMPTMKQQLEEQQATARLNALPTVTIPEFERDVDVFLYTHKQLREGTREQMEAYLMHMLHESFFVEGSRTQLNARGADLINKTLDRAFNPKSTYAQQYCPDPGVKHQQPGMMEWWNATQDSHTRMTVAKADGTWKNGQKVGETWKITALEVWMLTSPDDIARINSYEPGMLCKASADQPASKPAAGNSPGPAPTGTTSESSNSQGGNELLKKGKGMFNSLVKP